MKCRSAKNKGVRLQNEIAADIRTFFDLSDLDVRPAIMGESGRDIKFSVYAESKFCFDVESKNCERLNLWGSWTQCVENTKLGRKPLLVFSRNRCETLCCLRFKDLLALLAERKLE